MKESKHCQLHLAKTSRHRKTLPWNEGKASEVALCETAWELSLEID